MIVLWGASVVGCTIYEPPRAAYPPSAWQGTPQPQQPGGPPAYGGGGEFVQVPADRADAVWTTGPLAAGVDYVVEASGVFSAWSDHLDGVDAYYGYGQWRVGNTPEFWNQLLLDDRPMGDQARQNGESTAFNPNHLYTATIRGTGQRLKLQIMDARNGSWSDNHGALSVRVYPRAGAPAYAYPTPMPAAAPPPAPPPPMPMPGGDTVVVPADRGDPVWSNQPLVAGAMYLIEASGVWSAWGDHQDGIDAYYAYGEWRVGRTPELWNQLLIDDRGMADLAKQNGDPVGYNPAHVYATWVRGTGQRLKLQILDARNGSAGDNHGALQVRISRR
jgi:hypothetical protein